MFYTYAHIRKDTNSIFYIGKGTKRRMHRKEARNLHWHNVVKKAGYEAIKLAEWETQTEAFEHEKFLIQCFHGSLVNQSLGGDGNDAKGGFTFKGKKHSDGAKEKCRNANLGKLKSIESNKKNAESHKQKISINYVIYESWQDASKKTGIPTGSLSYLLKGQFGSKSKYKWINQISLVM
jgi:hypothetical protein